MKMKKYSLAIDIRTVDAQRRLLGKLLEAGDFDPNQVFLLKGLQNLCYELSKKTDYYPIIQGEELKEFADEMVQGCDVDTLKWSAATRLTEFWSSPEGEKDLDECLEFHEYFAKRDDREDPIGI